MIIHQVRETVLELGSLVVYYVWETAKTSQPLKQNYYWHDKTTEQSIGPFDSLNAAMADYVQIKKAVKEQKHMQHAQGAKWQLKTK